MHHFLNVLRKRSAQRPKMEQTEERTDRLLTNHKTQYKCNFNRKTNIRTIAKCIWAEIQAYKAWNLCCKAGELNVKLCAPVAVVCYEHLGKLSNSVKWKFKKKARCNSVISGWFGAAIAACQQTWGQAAKSPLKGSLSKGAYLNVLVFLCSSTFHHMYTEAGAMISYVFPGPYLSCCLYCALSASLALSVSSPLRPLCSSATLRFYYAP